MNLFKREVRANIIALIIWTVCSSMLLGVSFWEYGIMGDPDQMAEIFLGFPDIVNTVFGVSPLGMADIIGYAALIIYYIYFIGLAYALILGSKMLQKELDDNTSEFLFTKPISRNKIYSAKTAVAKLNMLFFVLVNFLVTTGLILNIGTDAYTNNEVIKYIALSYVGLYIIMLMTYFVTIAASTIFKEKKYSLAVGGFFIMYAYGTGVATLAIEKFSDFEIISPWRYFAVDVIVIDGFNFTYLAIAIVFVLIANAVAMIFVNRKTF